MISTQEGIGLTESDNRTGVDQEDDDNENVAEEWLRKPDTVFKDDSLFGEPEENGVCGSGMETDQDDNCQANNHLKLSEALDHDVKSLGCERLFELQKVMLRKVRQSCGTGGFFGFKHRSMCESDFCVCSPTGTGKTLAYLIPVVDAMESLQGSLLGQPKVLVLAPTKDLVDQIFDVCAALVKRQNLKVVKIGSSNFATQDETTSLVEMCPITDEYYPKADIVIATPGRLAEHLRESQGFSLKYLRFLIIDEADELFNKHPFDWLTQIEASVYCNDPAIPRIRSRKRLLKDLLRNDWVPLQKILVSATFPTADHILLPFNLQNPQLIISESIFKELTTLSLDDSLNLMCIPGTVSLKYLVCEAVDKPLMFLCFVLKLKLVRFLCIVNGSQTAEKLASLLTAVSGQSNVCFLSKSNAPKHAQLLKKFKQRQLNGIISSDVLARGVDQEFENVLIYDSVLDAKKFVHRVGRCGRAGRKGIAYSFVSPYEIDVFLHMTSVLKVDKLECMSVDEEHVKSLRPQYVECLQQLKNEATARQGKKLKTSKPK